jgi:Cu+-exporting ATPase
LSPNCWSFSNSSVAKVTFYIPAIHCSSCLWLLEHLYRIHPGIQQSRVDFLKKQVHLTYQPDQLTLRQLVELLGSVGYEPLDQPQRRGESAAKTVVPAIALPAGAGRFLFGQHHAVQFSEYLGLDDASFKHTFGLLNIVLAIPVVFYSASGYFESVWTSLKKGIINIDLPILLGILVAFFRGTYEVLLLNGAGYFDSLTGLIFFLLCGKWFQQRTHEFLVLRTGLQIVFPTGNNGFETGRRNRYSGSATPQG